MLQMIRLIPRRRPGQKPGPRSAHSTPCPVPSRSVSTRCALRGLGRPSASPPPRPPAWPVAPGQSNRRSERRHLTEPSPPAKVSRRSNDNRLPLGRCGTTTVLCLGNRNLTELAERHRPIVQAEWTADGRAAERVIREHGPARREQVVRDRAGLHGGVSHPGWDDCRTSACS